MVYKYFDKKTSSGTVKNENTSNKELAEEPHKPIIRKFNKKKVNSPFTDNISGGRGGGGGRFSGHATRK